ncbi:large subunit ribosomal protein L25 [Peptoniphilus asaccharolyticus DSM 20463]|uniref:Large ribosomal subunit protein bL25 n=1 Tax=Peptoniphilus asaccharolyticus DSM 20463 TaxID=573058 RepID=A0A1W1VH76_PEPAS|nr:50S ribosomal protein L25 [Peptoniphilus asaccharolyticus]MBL7574284.1 50S ribosomal protein L25 [Peptoniphilus asaccharolyticus]SMB92702.1 large subunit ribosomal protein L25 [Peptoniphilus asaccharolyticus DSM 20463]
MILNLKNRSEKGKNQVDKLRAVQVVPGVIYSKGNEAKEVSAVEKDLLKVYQENGTSSIFKVDLEGTTKQVLIKELQMHPFKNQIVHFDLYLIDMSEKIKVNIPVVLEGRDEVKVQPSVLLQVVNEIEVECLPADLPAEAIVNVVDMQIGDSILVKDLDVAKNEKIEVIFDLEETVATLQEPQEEVVAEEVESAEVPTVSETEAE